MINLNSNIGNIFSISLLVLAFLLPSLSYADLEGETDDIIGDIHEAGELSKNEGKWVPVPIPVANPTIGTGLQVALLYLHPSKSEGTPNPTSGIGAMYTNTESWFVGGFHDNYFKDDQYRLQVLGGYGEFNLDFFGFGDSIIPGGASIPYEFKGGIASIKALSRIPGAEEWYAGLQYLYLDSTITFKTSSVIPVLPDVTGEVKTAALGALVVYDSRDDNYNPTHGQYTELKYMNFGENWGGDYEYEKVIGFYNAYLPLTEKTTLALRTRLESSYGDTPFFNLAYLDMRGFARGRYQDEHSWSLHSEARYKFTPRWGVIGFYEVGWVNDDLSQITSGRKVASIGAGIRWKVTKDKNMNLGVDAAFSTDDKAFYVQIGESF